MAYQDSIGSYKQSDSHYVWATYMFMAQRPHWENGQWRCNQDPDDRTPTGRWVTLRLGYIYMVLDHLIKDLCIFGLVLVPSCSPCARVSSRLSIFFHCSKKNKKCRLRYIAPWCEWVCECVYAWCPAMDWHPIQAAFSRLQPTATEIDSGCDAKRKCLMEINECMIHF